VAEPEDEGRPEQAEEDEDGAAAEIGGQLVGSLGYVLEALEAGPEDLEDLSDRLFGAEPASGFEAVTLDHARRARESEQQGETADGAPHQPVQGEVEEYVRLSFRVARGEATEEERAEAERIEQRLRGDEEFEPEPLPEVDAAEFILEWQRQQAAAAAGVGTTGAPGAAEKAAAAEGAPAGERQSPERSAESDDGSKKLP